MQRYLSFSPYIDGAAPSIQALAAHLAAGCHAEHEIVGRCFAFVRDEIAHSVDFQRNPVTCKASDVLHHRTGYCYAKSHLLAALLRANAIPAGLCYQRVSLSGHGAPYGLHGFNAVYLQSCGWYRIDARGNKPGVCALFAPPREQLAFALRDAQERDYPQIWAEPLPAVIAVLERCSTYDEVLAQLPDPLM